MAVSWVRDVLLGILSKEGGGAEELVVPRRNARDGVRGNGLVGLGAVDHIGLPYTEVGLASTGEGVLLPKGADVIEGINLSAGDLS